MRTRRRHPDHRLARLAAAALAVGALTLAPEAAAARNWLYGTRVDEAIDPSSWMIWIGCPLALAVMLALMYGLGVAAARLFGTRYRDETVHRTTFVPAPISLAFLREKLGRGEIGPTEYQEQCQRLVD